MCCFLFVDCGVLFVVCLLFAVCCLWIVDCGVLFPVRCSSFVARCSLFVVRRMMCDVLLIVEWRMPAVLCCLMRVV